MPKRRRPAPGFAAIALIERRGRYLICRRIAGDAFGGCWEFPGGKRKAGESWEACLRRELREELGVAVRAISPYGRIRHRYAGRPILFQVYRCAIARGRPRPLASAALRWVAPAQLARYRFPPANRRLIARLTASQSR
jgi:mutator protein MutT